MKTFNELTTVQQEAAIQTILDIFNDKDLGVQVPKQHERDYAEGVAENSFYTDDGEIIMEQESA